MQQEKGMKKAGGLIRVSTLGYVKAIIHLSVISVILYSLKKF